MTPVENLYYALGELVFAIAKADGKIQKEEKEKLHDILHAEFKKHQTDLDVTEIIFHILQKDVVDARTAYDSCVKQIRLNSQYVSEQMKLDFIAVIVKVAQAFSPITSAEEKLINDFIAELDQIQGDPVFNKLMS
jgi:uncharacterized tellurite resistance protein B-like protein